MGRDRLDEVAAAVVDGRTFDEQVECVNRHGNHGTPSHLRDLLLPALGIAPPKPSAENLVMFGCYIPFERPFIVRDYVKLLDALGISYTYLDKEYCCGSPMNLTTGSGVEHDRSLKVSSDFMKLNCDQAREKGAKNIAYCCIGCVYPAKMFFKGEAERHLYYFELLYDKLEERTLKVAPTTIGYYEGCKTWFHNQYPNVEIDWQRCRRLLDRIEGLKVVELPNACCSFHPEKVVEAARKQKVDSILTVCNACYNHIGRAASGKVRVQYLTKLLLEAIGQNSNPPE